jgi:phage terminase small subunit
MLDLDVATPEQVAEVLRDAASKFHESAVELSAAWQDKTAGAIWRQIAKILEQAADKCDRTVAKA